MSVKYQDSTQKTLGQIERLRIDNKTILSKSFWRQYHCSLGCGACCLSFTLDYLPREWEKFKEHYPSHSALGVSRQVRGREIFTINPLGGKWCRFLDLITGICRIHDCNPISCQLELIKIYSIKGVTYVSKRPYGRAWQMRTTKGDNVLCDFSTFSVTQLLENDIPVLKSLLAWSNYFGMKTHLSEILDIIDICFSQRRFGRVEIAGSDNPA